MYVYIKKQFLVRERLALQANQFQSHHQTVTCCQYIPETLDQFSHQPQYVNNDFDGSWLPKGLNLQKPSENDKRKRKKAEEE